jgi:S-adenosyl-L-methionine methyltransferase
MSRLDSFIARMQAQRVLLNRACAELNAAGDRFAGPAIEFGLGNGRTYDHLRENLKGRRIVVFERSLQANQRSMPPPEDLVLGEIEETAPAFASTFGPTAALLHADLGNGVADDELKLERWLPGAAHALVRPGTLIITSTKLVHPQLEEQPLPPEIRPGRYYVYRRR